MEDENVQSDSGRRGQSMNRYVAFTFDTAEQAPAARQVLRDLENRNQLCLYDALVLVKDDSGRVTRQRGSSGVPVIGAMVGAILGAVLVFAFPIVGIVGGAGVGALLAMLLFERRIEEDYIASAEKDLKSDRSALLLLISSGDIAELGSAMRLFRLRVYQSTLPHQLHATLRESMKY